jgi:hypothetical protein
MTRRGATLHPALSMLSRAVRVSFGIAAIGLAGAIALVASEQPGRAGSAPQHGGRTQIAEPTQRRPQAGPSSVVVIVRSEEHASRVRADVGDIGGYLGGVPSSFLVVETDREAEIVRVLLKDDRDRLLIDFSDERSSAR